MNVKFVKVSPEMAADLLSRNFKNRPLSEKKVQLLIAEYRAGRWNPAVGQAIMTDKSGHLRNGQHRLSMVVRLGTTVEMMIIEGVCEDTFWQVDQNFGNRTFAQRLGLDGYKESSNLAPAITAYMLLHQSMTEKRPLGPLVKDNAPAEAERVRTLEENPSLAEWVAEVRALSKKHRFNSASSSIAAWATLAEQQISTAGTPLLKTFVEKLHSLDMCPSNGTIASARRAIQATPSSTKEGRATVLLILCRAWAAYAEGKELSVIRVNTKTNHAWFPKRVTR